MRLKLNRPLVFIDIEATGIHVAQDKIVEICLIKIHPDQQQDIYLQRFNPEIPIPFDVSEIHGIYDVDVIDEPVFKEKANELVKFIGNSDLAGFNSNKYDVPLLMEEFIDLVLTLICLTEN